MSNVLRRLPLAHLLLLCGTVVVVGIGLTALALALGNGPVPPPKPLAQAVQQALSSPPVQGVSARIQFTNHLLEGSELAGEGDGGEGSQLSSNPLLTGASGRLWIGADGHARLELQSERGDTQILYDGHRASLYDASTNILYRLVRSPEAGAGAEAGAGGDGDGPSGQTDHRNAASRTPSLAQVQEGIAHLEDHAIVSAATPTDVAGQPAYTVRVSPREHGGEIAGAELSWDADSGLPLRAAVYSTAGSSPTLELSASEVSYGPVAGSILNFQPPTDAKVENVKIPSKHDSGSEAGEDSQHARLHTHGQGLEGIAVLEAPSKPGEGSSESLPQGLQKVKVDGTEATELPTALGTLLSFERAGVRYLLAGSVTPSTIEAFARSL